MAVLIKYTAAQYEAKIAELEEEEKIEEAVKATSIYKTIRKYRIKNFILHYPKMIKKKLLK